MHKSKIEKTMEVISAIENWNPELYDHERKYQSDLKNYLMENLDEDYTISTNRDSSKGDIVVNDNIGIELKRNFSSRHKSQLEDQLDSYGNEYTYIISCSCGVDDRKGWEEMKDKYGGTKGEEFPKTGSRTWFIGKHIGE